MLPKPNNLNNSDVMAKLMQCLVGGLFVACLHIHPFAFVPFWLVPTHKSIFDLVDP